MVRAFAAAMTLLALLATSAQAQGTGDPSNPPGSGIQTEVKTPPMQASDTFILPIEMHPAGNPPWAGWAGSRMAVHILDPGEVDIDWIVPVTWDPLAGGRVPVGPMITNPFGPRSDNVGSVPLFFTMWHPSAPFSGIDLTGSVNQAIFNMQVHVKNSDPSGNSDWDVEFRFWNIWHVREHPGSTIIELPPSAYVWVPSFIQDLHQLHNGQPGTPGFSMYQFPTVPVNPETGHWLHLSEGGVFHLFGGPGSQFYATFLNTARLGIEHVPEPAAAVLLVAGVMCMGAGTWVRRRRRKQSS